MDSSNGNANNQWRVKVGLAEMLKGGVIMDVTNAEQADRRGRRRIRGDGAGARPRRHPQRGRRGAHGLAAHHGRSCGGQHSGDGQGAHRPLHGGAGARSAGGGLHRRERSAHAGRRGAPYREARFQGALRVRRAQSGRGSAAHRRRRGHDPHQGRSRLGQHRRGGAAHARHHQGDAPAHHAARRRTAARGQGSGRAARAGARSGAKWQAAGAELLRRRHRHARPMPRW